MFSLDPFFPVTSLFLIFIYPLQIPNVFLLVISFWILAPEKVEDPLAYISKEIFENEVKVVKIKLISV